MCKSWSTEISHKLLPECWKNLKLFCLLKYSSILRNFQVSEKCSLSGDVFFYSSPYLCFSPYALAVSNPSLIYIFPPHFLEIIHYKLNIYHAAYILTPCWTAFCCSTGNLCARIISPNINQASLLGNSIFLTHRQHSKNQHIFPSIF